MYIEKILFLKLYKTKQTLDKVGYEHSCSKDFTANQKCLMKVRAIGINFNITKWLQTKSKVIHSLYTIL